MKPEAWPKNQQALIMRVLMNRYHTGAPEVFLSGMQTSDAQAVLACRTEAEDPMVVVAKPIDVLSSRIHFSWIALTIDSMTPEMQPFFVGILPPQIAAPLSRLIKNYSPVMVSENAKTYFAEILYQKLGASHVLPSALLPQTSLSFLGNYTKVQLVEIIDYLGLYDLAQEVRTILDPKVLKGIFQLLSHKKQQFVRVGLHHKEKLTTAPIGLKFWEGDKEALDKILHKRGLQRLGNALAGQHEDLLWHISHCLDTGRAKLLMNSCPNAEIPGISSALTQQVLSVDNFLKKTGVE